MTSNLLVQAVNNYPAKNVATAPQSAVSPTPAPATPIEDKIYTFVGGAVLLAGLGFVFRSKIASILHGEKLVEKLKSIPSVLHEEGKFEANITKLKNKNIKVEYPKVTDIDEAAKQTTIKTEKLYLNSKGKPLWRYVNTKTFDKDGNVLFRTTDLIKGKKAIHNSIRLFSEIYNDPNRIRINCAYKKGKLDNLKYIDCSKRKFMTRKKDENGLTKYDLHTIYEERIDYYLYDKNKKFRGLDRQCYKKDGPTERFFIAPGKAPVKYDAKANPPFDKEWRCVPE